VTSPGLDARRARRGRARSSPFDPSWLVERHLEKDLAAAIGSTTAGWVVDVGCGGRPYEALVPSAARYLGLDLTPTMGSCPDLWARANALPLAGGLASLVLCTQVLEHVPDPHACVREMARILAPEGRLLVTAPQTWNLHEAPNDYYRFTRHGLEELCRQAGLEVLEVQPQGGFAAGIGVSIIMFLGGLVLGRENDFSERSRGSWLERALRLPLAAYNLLFAALDGWGGRGLGQGAFAVNHMIIARKPLAG